jgi:hypothetical protein
MNHFNRIGFWSALVAFISIVGFSVAQILQLIGILSYPLDAILIYGFSLFITTPFMLALLALHYTASDEKKFWSGAALLFSVMYNIFVSINYVVQLTVVIPLGISELAQTPHSLYWTLDALGYIYFGFATLFVIPVFKTQGLQKWLKGFLLANFLITPLIATVYFYPTFSTTLLLLATPWLITAPGSILFLTLYFRTKE